MAVPSTIADLSVTAASNSPSGADTVAAGTGPDDYLRAVSAILRREQAKATDVASATTVDLGAITTGNYVHVTGTTTITGFGTAAAGIERTLVFDAALTLTHNSTTLILPGGANITTAAGDVAVLRSEGSGNWRCVSYVKASGAPVGSYQPLDSELTAIAGLTSAANTVPYFTGSGAAALKTIGTASGNIPLVGTSSATSTVPGLVELATTAEAAAGTDTARAVTPAGLFGGLNATGTAPIYACRAWVNFNGTGIVAINASGNVTSITDNGTGDYTVNLTTAMPDANYAVSLAGVALATADVTLSYLGLRSADGITPTTKTTTACRVAVHRSNGTDLDQANLSVAIYR